jgi:DNA-directed RNA polymerase subunit RPC12/RpoP
MTPKQMITVNFSEISKVEIACQKCGAGAIFPVPQEAGQKYPPQSYSCLGCGALLWDGPYDERHKGIHEMVRSLAHWQALKNQGFSLSFSLISN